MSSWFVCGLQEAHKSVILVKGQTKNCGKELVDSIKYSEEVNALLITFHVCVGVARRLSILTHASGVMHTTVYISFSACQNKPSSKHFPTVCADSSSNVFVPGSMKLEVASCAVTYLQLAVCHIKLLHVYTLT